MTSPTNNPRPVVAAALVDSLAKPTQLLAARRSYPTALAGLYELPGGKVDEGESPVTALHREVHEELGVRILLGAPLPAPGLPPADTPGFRPWPILHGRVMWVWFAEVAPGQQPHAGGSHSSLDWIGPNSALSLPWLPTNLPIVEACLRAINDGPVS